MHSKHDPAGSLADIIENAARVAGYVTGIDRGGFERNALVRDAVERVLALAADARRALDRLRAEATDLG